jgi:RimJ/RimL family protein N-acetyltransferase
MPGPVFLEGEKVDLRTVEEEDIEFLRNGVNHPEVRKYMGNKRPQNIETQKEFIENTDDDTQHLLICTKDEEKAGVVSLIKQEDRPENMAKIGLWIHPNHQKKGFGTEASKLMTNYGFKQLDYHRIFARAYNHNESSQKIWERIGYEREGVLRDHSYSKGEYRDLIYFGAIQGEWND